MAQLNHGVHSQRTRRRQELSTTRPRAGGRDKRALHYVAQSPRPTRAVGAAPPCHWQLASTQDQLRAPRGPGEPPRALPASPADWTPAYKTSVNYLSTAFSSTTRTRPRRPQRSAVGATLYRWVVNGYLCAGSTRVVQHHRSKVGYGQVPARHLKHVKPKPYITTPARWGRLHHWIPEGHVLR